MKDRICLVTGVTAGIGKVTARELARRGATVVLVARDEARGGAVRDEIKAASSNDRVSLLLCDLGSQRQIRRLAGEVLALHPKIDVLVNNAGAIFGEREVTEDGVERTLATNHLAYFLLTNLLRPALEAAGKARVVSVASEAHRGQGLELDDLQFERRSYVSMRAYGQSKLANIVWSAELARRLSGTGVTANCLHPGVIASNFGASSGPGWMRFGMKLVAPFLTTPEQGAATSLYLATSPALEGVTGKYFKDEREKTPSAEARRAELGPKLWAISEELVAKSA